MNDVIKGRVVLDEETDFIQALIDNYPKISYTLQVCSRSKYAEQSGHVLKDGTIGAGLLMEFPTEEEARKLGKFLTPLYDVYLEKNTILSEKEDDFKTEVEKRPI